MAPLPGLRLLLGYRNYYTIHGSLYTSAYILTENTASVMGFSSVQHKMAKNLRMALCVARIECPKALAGVMGFSSASISAHSASVTVLGLLKKEEEEGEEKKELVQNSVLVVLRVIH